MMHGMENVKVIFSPALDRSLCRCDCNEHDTIKQQVRSLQSFIEDLPWDVAAWKLQKERTELSA